MAYKTKTECPIAFATSHFGDKWTLLILREVIIRDRQRFEEMVQLGESISTNILADRLRRLCDSGLLTKRVDPTNGRRQIYAPTLKALDLIPVLLEMIIWSGKHDEDGPDMVFDDAWKSKMALHWRNTWIKREGLAPQ